MDKIGQEFTTTEGYRIKIIKYFGWNNVSIQFDDNTIVKNKCYQHIKRGNIRHPYHKFLYCVGYLGQGRFYYGNCENYQKIKTVWSKMFTRSYCKKYQQRQPTYLGCTVDEQWYNFQNFAEWFENNYVEGWHLDKDILVKGCKIYSPETCCFVPREINNLFTNCISKRNLPIGVVKDGNKFRAQINKGEGVIYLGIFSTIEEAKSKYDIAKKEWCEELAIIYKDRVDNRIYNILISYTV